MTRIWFPACGNEKLAAFVGSTLDCDIRLLKSSQPDASARKHAALVVDATNSSRRGRLDELSVIE
jgi:hypothetical protein